MDVRCENIHADDDETIEALARLTVAAFQHIPYCNTIEEARAEIHEALAPGRMGLVARDLIGTPLGWVGGRPFYASVWEVHPLAVDPARRRLGIGRALMELLEDRVRATGCVTLMLGTDDEYGGTNLYGRDLYPNVLDAAQALESVQDHPFMFYKKLGFEVVGVVPDASGLGKPDILMAKRVTPMAGPG